MLLMKEKGSFARGGYGLYFFDTVPECGVSPLKVKIVTAYYY